LLFFLPVLRPVSVYNNPKYSAFSSINFSDTGIVVPLHK
jgi:hypothetical protein